MGVFFGKKRMTTATAKKTLVILLTVLELTSIPLPVAGEDKPKIPSKDAILLFCNFFIGYDDQNFVFYFLALKCYKGKCTGCTVDKPHIKDLLSTGKVREDECKLTTNFGPFTSDEYDPTLLPEGTKIVCSRTFSTETRKYEDTKEPDQVLTEIEYDCSTVHSASCFSAGCRTSKWPDKTKYGEYDRTSFGRTLQDNSVLGTDTKPNDAAAPGGAGDPAKPPDSPPEPAAAGVRRKRQASARENPDKIPGKKFKSVNTKTETCLCSTELCNGNGEISAGTNLLGSKHLLVSGLLLVVAPSAGRYFIQ